MVLLFKNNKKIMVYSVTNHNDMMTALKTCSKSKHKKRLPFALLLISIFCIYLMSSWQSSTNEPLQTVTLKLPASVTTTPTNVPEQLQKNIQHTVLIRAGDNLSTIFSNLLISRDTLRSLIKSNPQLRSLKQKSTLQLTTDENNQLLKLVYPLSTTKTLIITQKTPHTYKTTIHTKKTENYTRYATGTIKTSLSLAAKQLKLPSKISQQFSKLFEQKIDFSRDLRKGDQFTVLYNDIYADGEKIGSGPILAARFYHRGQLYTAVRYTNNNGKTSYYSNEGKSLQNTFSRFPTKHSHISSAFNLKRKHPILKTVRPHKGVDFAAPLGTPIKASGKGKIIFIGRKSGYGRVIKIKHNNKYTTLYAHILRFKKGLKLNHSVQQGDVIAYVGQSGLATGPHLHYEFHVKNKAVNPLTVKLPTSKGLPASRLADFKHKTATQLAQLDLYMSNSETNT